MNADASQTRNAAGGLEVLHEIPIMFSSRRQD